MLGMGWYFVGKAVFVGASLGLQAMRLWKPGNTSDSGGGSNGASR
jgi:hypothetical protein